MSKLQYYTDFIFHINPFYKSFLFFISRDLDCVKTITYLQSKLNERELALYIFQSSQN